MATTRPEGYRNYTADGTYWTVRKQRTTYWVVRIDPADGTYRVVETWGGYKAAGAAGGAAAQLAYNQAVVDATVKIAAQLQRSLKRIGLGAQPSAAPVKPPENLDLSGTADE